MLSAVPLSPARSLLDFAGAVRQSAWWCKGPRAPLPCSLAAMWLFVACPFARSKIYLNLLDLMRICLKQVQKQFENLLEIMRNYEKL
jgi:hypothetical protein